MLVLRSGVNPYMFREEILDDSVQQIVRLDEKTLPRPHTIKDAFLIGVTAYRDKK